MMNRKDLEANYKVISQVCKMYRKEITIYQAVFIMDNIPEYVGINDYIEFMNTLSLDTFIGNMLYGILNSENIDIFKQILANELTFEEFVEKYSDTNKFNELME